MLLVVLIMTMPECILLHSGKSGIAPYFEQQPIVHVLHVVPQHEEHFSPHLQSAEVVVFEVSVFGDATSDPIASTPAKINA